MHKILVLAGPTAVGKTEVSLILAKMLGAEIISADSMQIYKNLDVATAKLSLRKRQNIPHHLIDVADFDEDFSVARYQKLARKAIEDIVLRKKLPLIVGGSGLYIKALIDNLKFPEGELKSKFRKNLEQKTNKMGLEKLYEELKLKDPVAAKKIDPQNSRRLIRALEVIETTNKPFSDFQQDWAKWQSIYDAKIFGLSLPREVLYQRINERTDKMFASGLIDETKTLLKKNMEKAIVSKQSLGYKELARYLKGEIGLEEAHLKLKQKTRNFAKRQVTWFKNDPRIEWIEAHNKNPHQIATQIADKFIAL